MGAGAKPWPKTSFVFFSSASGHATDNAVSAHAALSRVALTKDRCRRGRAPRVAGGELNDRAVADLAQGVLRLQGALHVAAHVTDDHVGDYNALAHTVERDRPESPA